ncbi:hypothetical protein ABGB12_12670 [Actinocorallia sp. B10E7]
MRGRGRPRTDPGDDLALVAWPERERGQDVRRHRGVQAAYRRRQGLDLPLGEPSTAQRFSGQ